MEDINMELLEKLVAADSQDDILVIAQEYDAEITDEQAAQLLAEAQEIRDKEPELDGVELTDEMLMEVSGGISFSGLFSKAKSFFSDNKDSIIGAVTGAVGGWMGGKK